MGLINKIKKLLTSSLLSISLCSCAFNPFKKYANEYDNVVWVSTSASSIDLKIYVLDKNDTDITYSLCVINRNNSLHYMVAFPYDSFGIAHVNDYGIIDCFLSTSRTYLRNKIYKSEVVNFSCYSGSNYNYDFTKNLSINVNDYVEFEMKEFNPKEEATPLMFNSIKYTSETYNFSTKSRERGSINSPVYNTYFVSYGTMNINNVETNIALKFLPDNKFFIFRNDNINDIIISGTYTNNWTDITLNITENKIDNTTTMKLTGEFLKRKT